MFARVIQTKSSEIAKLTPRILSQADLVSRNPQLRQPREEFQASTHQWAGNVRDLINAMQQANLPWSRRADQLLEAARTGQGLESQVREVAPKGFCLNHFPSSTLQRLLVVGPELCNKSGFLNCGHPSIQATSKIFAHPLTWAFGPQDVN